MKENYESINDKIYFNELKKPLLTREEEKNLAQKIKEGDIQAKNEFIEKNLRLVISIAKSIYRNYPVNDLTFMDLVQEGNIGLMKAIDRYDATTGNKFSTYATSLIKSAITRSIYNKSKNIKLPREIEEDIVKLNKTRKKLQNEFNREPKIEELAEELDISKDKIIKLIKLQQNTISLNTLVNDEKSSELGDFISTMIPSPEELIIDNTKKEELIKLLNNCNLNENEINVLNLRYGFDDNCPKTYETIAEILGYSYQWIMKIEEKALKKIRNNKYVKSLADYMENYEEALSNIDKFRQETKKSKTKTYKK